jgi:UDP-N-acetylglucosamine transferase subunit ALG13
MNRAKFIVARAGYSTIMDVVELGKRALLIPTPGQTEQEYLAKYLDDKKYFCGRAETKVDLKYDIPLSETYSSFQRPWGTEKSVNNILNVIKRYT